MKKYNNEKIPDISVICLAYNAEKYIRKCLESILSQKVSISYEIIIHDDASTDGTQKIIESYKEKFPDIINPIYQEHNQYSKGVDIKKNFVLPLCKGKYIAFCEADDFWIDQNKLQIQYEYMTTHSDVSLCVHNTIKRDLKGLKKDSLFNEWKDYHVMNSKDIFFGWKVHTSSYMVKKDVLTAMNYSKTYWFGDYILLTMAYNLGKVVCLPMIMSVYNYNNKNGAMYWVRHMDLDSHIEKILDRKKYLKEFDEFTQKKYHDIILQKYIEIDFQVIKETVDFDFFDLPYGKEVINRCRKVRKSVYFNRYLETLSLEGRIWSILQYSGNPVLFWILKKYIKMKQ